MKILQNEAFQPITIVIETKEEAMALWEIVEQSKNTGGATKKMATSIVDWLTNEAHL